MLWSVCCRTFCVFIDGSHVMCSRGPLFYRFILLLGRARRVPDLAASNQAKADNPCSVRLFINRAGSGKAMDVSNTLEVPVEVTLRLTRMVNVAGVGMGVIRKTIPANSRFRVATMSKRKAGGPLMFKHSFSYALLFSSEPDQPDSSYVERSAYSLPWPGGP